MSSSSGSLKRTLGTVDVVAITVSAVTPASSVFVIAPFAIQQAGSGAFLAFVLAAVLALMYACCYSELGCAHRSAGADYVYAKRVFGGVAGYAMFFVSMLSMPILPPLLATGAATYLNVALGTQFDTHIVALAIVAASFALGVLNIKLNAWVTGLFLLLEVAVLLVIVVLGFGNAQQPMSVLLQPQLMENGVLSATPMALVFAAVGTALFSYNGFAGAVIMVEDMKCGGRTVHKAVLWSLLLVVVIELMPVVALLIGEPSLAELIASKDPIGYVLSSLGNETLVRLVSAGIFLSVFNAVIAIVIQMGRIVFSTGRDQLWTPALNSIFTRIHPRWESPWLATLALAAPAILLSLTSNLAQMTSFTVLLLVITYLVSSLAAVFSRVLRSDVEHSHRMPLWPLPALLAVIGSGYLLSAIAMEASPQDFLIIAGLLAVSVIFYAAHGKFSPTFQKL